MSKTLEGGVERQVPVKKIVTIFPDSQTLQRTAERVLHSSKIVSGYSVSPIQSAHIYKGEKNVGPSHSLSILVPADAAPEDIDMITDIIRKEIGKHWEAPLIEVTDTTVNESAENFIRQAPIEHDRYRRSKRINHIGSVVLGGVTMLLAGIGIELHGQKKGAREAHEHIHKAERVVEELINGQEGIQEQIRKGTLRADEQPAEFGVPYNDDVRKVAEELRRAKTAVRKLAE